MDIREGITIIKEQRGSTQVNRNALALIFCYSIFVIAFSVCNVLTSLFIMEHKFVYR